MARALVRLDKKNKSIPITLSEGRVVMFERAAGAEYPSCIETPENAASLAYLFEHFRAKYEWQNVVEVVTPAPPVMIDIAKIPVPAPILSALMKGAPWPEHWTLESMAKPVEIQPAKQQESVKAPLFSEKVVEKPAAVDVTPPANDAPVKVDGAQGEESAKVDEEPAKSEPSANPDAPVDAKPVVPDELQDAFEVMQRLTDNRGAPGIQKVNANLKASGKAEITDDQHALLKKILKS